MYLNVIDGTKDALHKYSPDIAAVLLQVDATKDVIPALDQLIVPNSFTSMPLNKRVNDADSICAFDALSKAVSSRSIVFHSFELYSVQDQSFKVLPLFYSATVKKVGESSNNPDVAKTILTLYDILASDDRCRDTLGSYRALVADDFEALDDSHSPN